MMKSARIMEYEIILLIFTMMETELDYLSKKTLIAHFFLK